MKFASAVCFTAATANAYNVDLVDDLAAKVLK